MFELLWVVFVAAVMWCAWPYCRRPRPGWTGRGLWWLIVTMALIPWLAWLYWVPRGVRYRVRRRQQLYQIVVPTPNGALVYSDRSIPYPPDRRARRRARRRDAQPLLATATQYRDSVRFWTECQRSGTPAEQALAPQMLAFLDESLPPEQRRTARWLAEPSASLSTAHARRRGAKLRVHRQADEPCRSLVDPS